MSGRLKRPLNKAAVKKAEAEFSAKHPELKGKPLNASDPKQAALRQQERMDLYVKHGGELEAPNEKTAKTCGGTTTGCSSSKSPTPKPTTVCDYIALTKKVEKAHPDWSGERVLNALRHEAGYDDERFKALYGSIQSGDSLLPTGELTQEDINNMRELSRHSGNTKNTEKGIAKDSLGHDVAIGHVLTGMSAGMHRKQAIQPTTNKSEYLAASLGVGENIDNLYATTVTGDIGQELSIRNRNIFFGNDLQIFSCFPILGIQITILIVKLANLAIRITHRDQTATQTIGYGTEATHAELVGDIDGFILGSQIDSSKMNKAPSQLSKILNQHYGCQGESNTGIETRFNHFDKLTDQKMLLDQIKRFSTSYNYKLGKVYGLTTNLDDEVLDAYNDFRSWLEREKQREQNRLDKSI